MPVPWSVVAKAVATTGRASRKEAVARATSSVYAQAHRRRNQGWYVSGGMAESNNRRKTGSKGMVKQTAARRAALSYAPHHREMPSRCAAACSTCVMESAQIPQERLQRFRGAGPLQHLEDPPVVDAGVRAGEVGEKDARVFRVTGALGDGRRFDLLS